jgi:hypothetical protein
MAVDFKTALMVSVSNAMALVLHGMAVANNLLVVAIAFPKALLCEAIKIFLVMLVGILECVLDTLHEHVTDGMKRLLDVIIEFPSRLRDGLLSEVLNQSLHLGDISMTHSSQKILCSRRSFQSGC